MEESKPSRLHIYWDRAEYWEESWRPEEIYCHSDLKEKPPGKASAKTPHNNKKDLFVVCYVVWIISFHNFKLIY